MSDTLILIPLNKLERSKENARKTEPSAEVDALAASIEVHGLLQNLTVRPLQGKDGPNGRYEVVAGARRLEALKLLAKTRRLPKDAEIPCAVLTDDRAGDAAELSLAENVMRVPLHPADQFEAFLALQQGGLGPEEIAARFGVTPKVVLQRLKLAAVSPRLMAVYREGGMTLDQLTAFTISDDHEAQERVWFEYPHDKNPDSIRRWLTKTLVEGSDRRARFVGAEAYEQAGGRIICDLFKEAHEGYFEDSQLLDRLTSEKLTAEAERVKAEGWSWVEVLPEMDYGYLAQFRHLMPKEVPLSKRDQKRLDRLCKRHDKLIAELEDEPDEAAVAELDRIQAKIDALSKKREQWSEKDISRSGAVIALDYNGNLQIVYGLVKPKPQKAAKAKVAEQTEQADEENATMPEKADVYSESLLEELSAHRTAALRATLASQPEVALTALLHTLILQTFFGVWNEFCIRIKTENIDLGPFGDGLGESKAVVAMAERHSAWSQQLPEEHELWSWLEQQAHDTRLELLAYCIACTVNAVRQRYGPTWSDRCEQADTIARAVSLDMTLWWRPTQKTYFDRVTKQQIMKAVSEAVSPEAANNIAEMKKAAMAARAEKLMAETTWLPEPLRTPQELNPEAAADAQSC